jgi:hypothetical protein
MSHHIVCAGVQNNFDFRKHACRRHQAAIYFRSGDFGTSPFFGQQLVKVISLTVRHRTILVV